MAHSTVLISAPESAQPVELAVAPLGVRMRADFRRYIARGSLRGFRASRFYVELVRPILFLVRTAWCLLKFGRGIAAAGRPLHLQALDMIRLGWAKGIDPILYPTLELYRPGRRAWTDHALSQFEVDCGMLRRLHKLRPKPLGARIDLRDRLVYHVCCRAHGLPSPPILIHVQRGDFNWLEAAKECEIDCDLFIKPRDARSTRKILWLRRIDSFRWRTNRGEIWTRDHLFEHLRRQSRHRDMLVQPLLTNGPQVADLADQSLIAIRVITCMDASGIPVVTHAMLRVLSRLEPLWRSRRELGARIDLQTGRLGPLCNDKDLWPGCWSDRHPVTDARVTGRVLESWPEIRALAMAAHRVFCDRMLIGWDIAITPSGPVLLQGNAYPDVHFLQRVHDQPIGFSSLGPLLLRALDQVRVRDKHLI